MALEKPLKGGLYIVATPIGNLGDITLRALETLKGCDVIACEDTRVSRKLLSAYSIDKPVMSYHDHNADQARPFLLDKMKGGQAVALISDAGTPLISDPGYKLVRQCYEADLPVTFLPGASAVIAGLVLSGMPTDRFLFAGFAGDGPLATGKFVLAGYTTSFIPDPDPAGSFDCDQIPTTDAE